MDVDLAHVYVHNSPFTQIPRTHGNYINTPYFLKCNYCPIEVFPRVSPRATRNFRDKFPLSRERAADFRSVRYE